MMDRRRTWTVIRALGVVLGGYAARFAKGVAGAFKASAAKRRTASAPPPARGPVERTPAWKKATAYHYDRISIRDEGTRIILAFKNVRVQKPGALSGALWTFGQGLAGLAVAGTTLALIFGGYQLVIPGIVVSIALFLISWQGSAASTDGAFGVTDKNFFYKQFMDGGAVRRVERSLFDGIVVDHRNEYNFASGQNAQPGNYWYVAVRFGAVRNDVAVFRSQAVADQLAILINEAMKQRLGAPMAQDPVAPVEPFSPKPKPSVPPGIHVIKDEDL